MRILPKVPITGLKPVRKTGSNCEEYVKRVQPEAPQFKKCMKKAQSANLKFETGCFGNLLDGLDNAAEAFTDFGELIVEQYGNLKHKIEKVFCYKPTAQKLVTDNASIKSNDSGISINYPRSSNVKIKPYTELKNLGYALSIDYKVGPGYGKLHRHESNSQSNAKLQPNLNHAYCSDSSIQDNSYRESKSEAIDNEFQKGPLQAFVNQKIQTIANQTGIDVEEIKQVVDGKIKSMDIVDEWSDPWCWNWDSFQNALAKTKVRRQGIVERLKTRFKPKKDQSKINNKAWSDKSITIMLGKVKK